MAETSGFFPSVNGDRKYKADWLAKYIHSFIANGVYNNELAVLETESMKVKVSKGRAWINGYFYENDDEYLLDIENADGVLNRIDSIVLQYNINERAMNLKVLKGAYAQNPQAPALTRNVEVYELKLANIAISKGTTHISQASIQDTRLDNTVCGLVHNPIDQIDTHTLYLQIQADLAEFKNVSEEDFLVWLDNIKGKLSGDLAGKLQLQIDEITSKIDKNDNDIAQLSNPNLLINGDFQVWQRGNTAFMYALNSGQTQTKVYGADRFLLENTRTDTNAVINRIINDNGKSTGMCASISGVRCKYLMELSDYKRIQGKIVTLSYSINKEVFTETYKLPILEVDTTYGVVFDKPLPYNEVLNWVKLELGSIATPFVPRPFAEELNMCKRYYQELTFSFTGYADSIGLNQVGTIYLNADMRVFPTITELVKGEEINIKIIHYANTYDVGLAYFSIEPEKIGTVRFFNKRIKVDAEIY